MFGRRFAFFAIAASLFVGYTAPALSQTAPSLIGTWKSIHYTQSSRGITTIDVELVIDEQVGGLFNGRVTWQLLKIGERGVEDILGVIGWDNKTITIVNVNDTGYTHGYLVNNVTIEHIYFESGNNAVVSRGVWRKQPDISE